MGFALLEFPLSVIGLHGVGFGSPNHTRRIYIFIKRDDYSGDYLHCQRGSKFFSHVQKKATITKCEGVK